MMQRFEAIIFDLDGVLVDSEEFYYQRRKAFLKNYNLSIEQIPIQFFIGADMRSLWKLIFEVNDTIYDETFLTEHYLKYKEEHPIDYSNLIEADAKKVLQYLKRNGYKIGLASSSTTAVIQEVLKEGQFTSYFDVVVSGTQFEKSKPNPEIYEYTASKLGVRPENCLVIEDSEKGIRAAYDAKMCVWALKDLHFGMDQRLANDSIATLSEVCKKLQLSEEVG